MTTTTQARAGRRLHAKLGWLHARRARMDRVDEIFEHLWPRAKTRPSWAATALRMIAIDAKVVFQHTNEIGRTLMFIPGAILADVLEHLEVLVEEKQLEEKESS